MGEIYESKQGQFFVRWLAGGSFQNLHYRAAVLIADRFRPSVPNLVSTFR